MLAELALSASPPDRWMTNARMTHYQILLLTERVMFAPPAILNTAMQSDLRDQPWPGVPNWYTDGSSFLVEGKRMAGVGSGRW